MSTNVAAVVSDNLDLWTSAIERKSGAGRGGGKKVRLYGIERLRALILDLAVRGKLVQQDAGDEFAASLLQRIDKARSKLIDDGFIRGAKAEVDRSNVAGPFSIPPSWAWVRLDRLGAIVGGGTPSAGDPSNFAEPGEGVAWLTPADLSGYEEKYVGRGQRDLSDKGAEECSAKVMPPGSVLFTSRAPIGYVAIAANDVATNQGFKSIVPSVEGLSEFIALTLKAFAEEIDADAPGTTFKEVSGKIVSAIPFPLPPLAEQQRIVTKVDELMALCDALEAQSTSALEAHQTLVDTLLATLVNATDLARQWTRLATHFDTLFTTDVSVVALKQTVLELAVRGKLVEQNVEDEAGEGLLRRIAKSNSYRVASGQSKRMRSNSPPLDLRHAPFELPCGWLWTSLDQLAFKITDGAHHTPTYTHRGVPFLSVKDMSAGKLDFSDTRFISEEQHAELYRRCDPELGDLLITKVGTTGVPVIVDTDRPFSLFVSVALIKAPWDLISVEFLRLMIDSPFVRKQSADGTQGIGNKNLVLRTIGAFWIPLPPLAEQKRIVTKVDELVALCDALSARLGDAAQTRKHLADAVVERAVA